MTKWKEGQQIKGWIIKEKQENHFTVNGKKLRKFSFECPKCGYTRNCLLQSIDKPHNCSRVKKINSGLKGEYKRVKLTHKINFRLCEEDMRLIENVSKIKNKKLSALIRDALLQAIKIIESEVSYSDN